MAVGCEGDVTREVDDSALLHRLGVERDKDRFASEPVERHEDNHLKPGVSVAVSALSRSGL